MILPVGDKGDGSCRWNGSSVANVVCLDVYWRELLWAMGVYLTTESYGSISYVRAHFCCIVDVSMEGEVIFPIFTVMWNGSRYNIHACSLSWSGN